MTFWLSVLVVLALISLIVGFGVGVLFIVRRRKVLPLVRAGSR